MKNIALYLSLFCFHWGVAQSTFVITSSTATSATGNISSSAGSTFSFTRLSQNGFLNPIVFSVGPSAGIEVRNESLLGNTVADPDQFSYNFSVVPGNNSCFQSIVLRRLAQAVGTGTAECADYTISWVGGGFATLNDPDGDFTSHNHGDTISSGTVLSYQPGPSFSNPCSNKLNTDQIWSVAIPSNNVTVDVLGTANGNGDMLFNEWIAFDANFNPPPNATINQPNIFCVNDMPINLIAASPGGVWSGTGIIDSINGTFSPNVAGMGSHEIFYSIGLGCSNTDSTLVEVFAIEDASFNYPSAMYCSSDFNPLPNITGLAGGTFSMDSMGVIDPISGQIDLSASGLGTFIVSYTTNGNCPQTSNFMIEILATPELGLSQSNPFCINDLSLNLNATAIGGIWSGIGITDSINGTFNPSIAGVGTHNIRYSLDGLCPSLDSIDVGVLDLDDASFNYTSSTYCSEDQNPLPNIIGLAGGTFSIDNPGVIDPITGQIDIVGSGIGSFMIRYMTDGSCPNSESFEITIIENPDASIVPVDALCIESPSFDLTALNTGGNWTGNGVINSNDGTFSPSVAGEGLHQITYSFSGLCDDVQSISIEVVGVDSTFEIQFSCDPSEVGEVSTSFSGQGFICDSVHTIRTVIQEFSIEAEVIPSVIMEGNSAMLFTEDDTNVQYQWTLNDGSLVSQSNTSIVRPVESTVYYLSASYEGCSYLDSVELEVLPIYQFSFPTAFSPNGDGVNDGFGVINYQDFEQIQMSIYNRWGELIYFEESSNPIWDGSYKGVRQDVGVYSVQLEGVVQNLNEVIFISGNLSLLR